MTEYINRQAVLDLLWKDGRITTSGIKAIPAAGVAPVVHGRWVKVKPVHYQCSVCGINTGGFTSNYCPSCGAKMDKEAKNGD